MRMGSFRSRSDRGQSSVLAAMLCGMIVVVIAMTTNIGTLVTEKMAMQNALDLAAYSGAATQAMYLNAMREHNQHIWSRLHELRAFFQTSAEPLRDPGVGLCATGTPYKPGDRMPNCREVFHDSSSDSHFGLCAVKSKIPSISFRSEKAERYAQDVQDYIIEEQTKIEADNLFGKYKAAQNAADTANKNYPGLGNGGIFHSSQGDYAKGMVELRKANVDVSYFGYCVEYPFFGTPRVHVAMTKTDVHLPGNPDKGLTAWYFKIPNGDVLFAAKVENAHPADSFMDVAGGYFMNGNDRCWGGNDQRNGRCGMSLYAAAMPFYGKLGTQDCATDSRYCRDGRNRWNQAGSGVFALADHPGALDPEQPNSCRANSGYCNYRVRMIGIFENDLNYVGSGVQAQVGFVPASFAGKIVH